MFKKIIISFISGIFLMGIFSPTIIKADNQGPVVFVHGLVGWGKGEVGPINYWGGRRMDLIQKLNDQHPESTKPVAYEGVVSPFGSVYDRSVELYYYIKGGTVDYGIEHSEKTGHARYGRTFPGIYPEWDENHPIHLVGHSMGGQTARELETLLRHGSADEVALSEARGEQPSNLYTGTKSGWIKSVTTMATPHNGTSIATDIGNKKLVRNLLSGVAGLAGTNVNKLPYDFKLDQWGLKQQEGESINHYNNRVLESSIWNSKDISLYDLTTPGAEELNSQTDLSPDTYYYTYSGQTTKADALGFQVPVLSTTPVLRLTAQYIGHAGNSQWWANDGAVPVISGEYPSNQAHVKDSHTIDQPGIWQYNEPIQGWDHTDFTLLDLFQDKSIENQFLNMYSGIVNRDRAL